MAVVGGNMADKLDEKLNEMTVDSKVNVVVRILHWILYLLIIDTVFLLKIVLKY